MVLGRSLATGHGYRMINEPQRPPHRQYPPGLPVLLAVIMRGCGVEAYGMMRLAVGGCGVAAMVLWWCWLRQRLAGSVAWLVAVATAVLPMLVDQAHMVLSEASYLAASVAALMLLERWLAVGGSGRPWLCVASALAVALACLMRAVGIVLLAVAVAAWVTRRLRRQPHPSAGWLAVWVGVAIAPLLGWTWRTLAVGQPFGSEYVSDWLLVNPAYPHLGVIGWGGFWERCVRHGVGYIMHLGWALVFFNRPLAAWQWAVVVVIGALGVIGWWSRWREEGGVWEWYLAAYLAAIAAWSWVAPRMVGPILPLGVWYLLSACQTVYRACQPTASDSAARRLWLALTIVWIVAAAPPAAAQAAAVRRPQAGGTTRAMWAWLREATPLDAVIASPGSALLFLQTGRPTVELPRVQEPDRFVEMLEARGARYLVVDTGWEPMAWYAVEAMRHRPDRLMVRQRIGNLLCLEILPAPS